MKLYNQDKTKVIGKRSNYGAYKYGGKYYYYVGSGWTGWQKEEMSKKQWNKLINWCAKNAEKYEVDRIFKTSTLQLAKRHLRLLPPETIIKVIN